MDTLREQLSFSFTATMKITKPDGTSREVPVVGTGTTPTKPQPSEDTDDGNSRSRGDHRRS
jgi:hypothetical protein